MKNEKNLTKFPQCVADDIMRQVHELSTSVYQIRGYIKGKTLLPFPQVKCSFKFQFYFFLSITILALLIEHLELNVEKKKNIMVNPRLKAKSFCIFISKLSLHKYQ